MLPRSLCRILLSCFFVLALAAAMGSAVCVTAAEAKTKSTTSSTKGKHKAKSKEKALNSKRGRTKKAALPVADTGLYADIVIEARTGRVLHAVNATSLRHPASLTKMMTLYLVFQALESGKLSLESRIPVSAEAASQSPTKLGLRAGQSVRVQDAILGLVTVSANDASVVLAEAVGGTISNFARMMTRQARALGMDHTVFQNPNGLPDPDQVTTARDMAVLGQALIYHYPRFYPYFSQESFVYAGSVRRNHNHLMERYDGMDGIKTGYIRASGFNLVASAVRNNVRLIGVVFGGRSAPARDNVMEELLDKSFDVAMGRADPNEAQGQGDAADESLGLPQKTATQATNQAITQQVPQPSAAPLPPTSLPPKGNWAVQVGAFSDQATAQAAQASVARAAGPLLANAEPQMDTVAGGDGKLLYRVRFRALDERMARSVCAYLLQHGQNCLVVAP